MAAILYPVALNADAALAAPIGRAERAREAEGLAGDAVAFTSEPVGPVFATREAALAAYAGKVEDDRPGHLASPAPEDRYCQLTQTLAPGVRPAPAAAAVCADGKRWSTPAAPPPPTVWRLLISYWRVGTAERPIDTPQARQARRRGSARAMDTETLRAMSKAPLRPVEPQQALDIGLFERRLPESPHIIVPDE